MNDREREAQDIAAATRRPVAWLHDHPGRFEVIHDDVKDLWLRIRPEQVKNYTIPLYRHAYRQPLSTDDACTLLKNALGIDPMFDGNLLKMLRAIEQAHDII